MRLFVRVSLFALFLASYVCNAHAQALTVKTLAGNGVAGFTSDGVAATSSSLNNPSGVAVDLAGNVYIADRSSHRIRKVSIGGVITTIAGTGTAGFGGDGDNAIGGQIDTPTD